MARFSPRIKFTLKNKLIKTKKRKKKDKAEKTNLGAGNDHEKKKKKGWRGLKKAPKKKGVGKATKKPSKKHKAESEETDSSVDTDSEQPATRRSSRGKQGSVSYREPDSDSS